MWLKLKKLYYLYRSMWGQIKWHMHLRVHAILKWLYLLINHTTHKCLSTLKVSDSTIINVHNGIDLRQRHIHFGASVLAGHGVDALTVVVTAISPLLALSVWSTLVHTHWNHKHNIGYQSLFIWLNCLSILLQKHIYLPSTLLLWLILFKVCIW